MAISEDIDIQTKTRAAAPVAAASEPARGRVVVKPVANAIKILSYLSQPSGRTTVTHIARALNINTSTCFNILRTLVGEGMVTFDPASKSYGVGLALLKLARRATSEGDYLAAAAAPMHEVADRFSATITLWRRLGADRIMLVLAEHSSRDLGIQIRTGQRLPILLGATGRIMAPHLGLSDEELRAQFDRLRWAQPISFEEFRQGVEEASERGWALDDGHFSTGTLAVAAPVTDGTGAARYSLVAVVFRGQHDEEGVRAMGEALIELGERLQAILF